MESTHLKQCVGLPRVTTLCSFSAAAAAAAKSLQSCLTPCDPRNGSPPGSPVLGILQARTLEPLVNFRKANNRNSLGF